MTHYVWYEEYRPQSIDDCILPVALRQRFKGIVSSGCLTDHIFSGKAGVGKTSVAKALCIELGYDMLFVNGSNEGKLIDTLRSKITQFAGSVSLKGNRKVVLIDEADQMPEPTQLALRAFIEQYSSNCSFILTCNFRHRIVAPLSDSRFTDIEFDYPKEESEKLQFDFFKRAIKILKSKTVPYDSAVLAKFVSSKYPDFRGILVDLQSYSVCGKIDAGILTNTTEAKVSEVVGLLKDKNFKGMRSWVAVNEMDFQHFVSIFYQEAEKHVERACMPKLVMLLNTFQRDQHLCVDREIFMAACLTEMMGEIEWLQK